MTDRAQDSPPRDWAGLWENVTAAISKSRPFERVYTGPPWEDPPSLESVGTRVWKIAVLERIPGKGAVHWGHLFVLVGPTASTVVIRPEGGLAGDRDPRELEVLPSPPGSLVQIRLRPRSSDTRASLREFALAFQRHALMLAPR